jgi:hypothetical protein
LTSQPRGGVPDPGLLYAAPSGQKSRPPGTRLPEDRFFGASQVKSEKGTCQGNYLILLRYFRCQSRQAVNDELEKRSSSSSQSDRTKRSNFLLLRARGRRRFSSTQSSVLSPQSSVSKAWSTQSGGSKSQRPDRTTSSLSALQWWVVGVRERSFRRRKRRDLISGSN